MAAGRSAKNNINPDNTELSLHIRYKMRNGKQKNDEMENQGNICPP